MKVETASLEALEAMHQVKIVASSLTTWPEVKVFDENESARRMSPGIPLGLRRTNKADFQPDLYDVLTPTGIFEARIHNSVRIHQGVVDYMPSVYDGMPEVEPDVYLLYKDQAIQKISREREREDGQVIKDAWVSLTD